MILLKYLKIELETDLKIICWIIKIIMKDTKHNEQKIFIFQQP